ncbi:hypothetical protein [Bartonella heixiaziensis]|uniref:hypothetical protein n=1 Tax=Bartonella heixiaziensis TaxID=1461000 RepID=UPI003D1C1A60
MPLKRNPCPSKKSQFSLHSKRITLCFARLKNSAISDFGQRDNTPLLNALRTICAAIRCQNIATLPRKFFALLRTGKKGDIGVILNSVSIATD